MRTKDSKLTPLLVAASYNRKNAVLWLLQDGRERINVDATNSEGRNAIHLACLDLQCQYTIEARLFCKMSVHSTVDCFSCKFWSSLSEHLHICPVLCTCAINRVSFCDKYKHFMK